MKPSPDHNPALGDSDRKKGQAYVTGRYPIPCNRSCGAVLTVILGRRYTSEYTAGGRPQRPSQAGSEILALSRGHLGRNRRPKLAAWGVNVLTLDTLVKRQELLPLVVPVEDILGRAGIRGIEPVILAD